MPPILDLRYVGGSGKGFRLFCKLCENFRDFQMRTREREIRDLAQPAPDAGTIGRPPARSNFAGVYIKCISTMCQRMRDLPDLARRAAFQIHRALKLPRRRLHLVRYNRNELPHPRPAALRRAAAPGDIHRVCGRKMSADVRAASACSFSAAESAPPRRRLMPGNARAPDKTNTADYAACRPSRQAPSAPN